MVQLGARERHSLALAEGLGVHADRIVYQVDEPSCSPGRRRSTARSPSTAYIAVTLDASFASEEGLPGLRGLAAQLAVVADELGLGLVFVPHVGELGERAGGDVACRRPAGAPRRAGRLRLPCHAGAAGGRGGLGRTARGPDGLVPLPPAGLRDSCREAVHRHRPRCVTHAKLHGALAHVGADRWCLPVAAAEAGALAPAIRALWADREAMGERAAQTRPVIDDREAARRTSCWSISD